MNDAYQDFLKHSEIDWNQKQQEARSWMNDYYEDLASKYEITVDYLMAEFILD